MKKVLTILSLMLALLIAPQVAMAQEHAEGGEHEEGVNPKELIFEHLGDAYGWEAPFSHNYRIPLPIIIRDHEGAWHVFSSHNVEHGAHYGNFYIASEGDYRNKIVEDVTGENGEVEQYRPLDLSITKNVAALIISALVVVLCVMSVKRWYKKHGMSAPRKWTAAIEFLVEFIYYGVIAPTLGKNAKRFAPYLLTVFFFIFTMNLLGLIVIFPGGANLTGNIAITLVLALMTFVVTNISGNKHYWLDIFWPEVPIWLKFPLPIMQVIEVFGMFTKPAALCVRLFANMMGGHMIVIVLTLLIFIFASYGVAVASFTATLSVAFSLFMLLLDTLVSFIQAFVFTMLSTLFISLAVHEPHAHEAAHEE